MKRHWLVFDLDGTLLDSNHVWTWVDDEFLARRGKVSTPEYREFTAHAIFPTAAKFTKEYYHLEESEQAIMDAWAALARDAYQFHIPLKEGVREFLTRCALRKESIALFTASLPELCRLALRRHDLERFFDRVVFAQDFGLEKRNPRAFTALAETLGAEPKDCVLFDDSPRNCLAAKSAGLRVVGVYDSFFAAAEEEMRANCHRFLRGFPELLENG